MRTLVRALSFGLTFGVAFATLNDTDTVPAHPAIVATDDTSPDYVDTFDPAVAVLDRHRECLTGAGPAGEIPSAAIVRHGDDVKRTADVDMAIRVALGDVDAPAGYDVVAFCYDSLTS